MALVPGGEYKPSTSKKSVSVASLCVDVTETTAQGYAECVQGGACKTDNVSCGAESTYGKADKATHPMVCVDFSQASAYCAFRGKRLPKTEEWEWAARGTTEARQYPWGAEAPAAQLCWTGKQKQKDSCDVGSFPAGDTPQGLKDLAGNVLEFTTTDLDAKSTVRIARGGSWRDGVPELVRVSRVGGFGLSYRCTYLGIRCVSEAK